MQKIFRRVFGRRTYTPDASPELRMQVADAIQGYLGSGYLRTEDHLGIRFMDRDEFPGEEVIRQTGTRVIPVDTVSVFLDPNSYTLAVFRPHLLNHIREIVGRHGRITEVKEQKGAYFISVELNKNSG